MYKRLQDHIYLIDCVYERMRITATRMLLNVLISINGHKAATKQRMIGHTHAATERNQQMDKISEVSNNQVKRSTKSKSSKHIASLFLMEGWGSVHNDDG